MPHSKAHKKRRAAKKVARYTSKRHAAPCTFLVIPRATPKSTTPLTEVDVDFSDGVDGAVITVVGYGQLVHALAAKLRAVPPATRTAVKRRMFSALYEGRLDIAFTGTLEVGDSDAP